MSSLAEFERELIQERIRSGIAAAKARGKRLGRQLGQRPKSDRLAPRVLAITGLTWIVERTFAWLGRNRRLSKDYEYAVQETFIDIAAIRLMLNRIVRI